MKKIFLVLLLTLPALFYGQNVSGTVVDPTGIPLPGVNIIVKNTTTGTQTDFDGNYTISASAGDVLVFSFIGFTTQEVVYAAQETIDITLEEETNTLDDVVVIGYGTQRKADITTSVSSVKAEELRELPVTDIEQALEGRAAGVQVRSGGAPGEENQVVIRGIGTFGNGNPTYVVDGAFVDNINQLNPASIESIEILKDAAATSIYGARGLNGVVIITTKKGEIGNTKFNFSTYGGQQWIPRNRLYDVISGQDLVDIAFVEDLSLDTQDDPNTPINETELPNTHPINIPNRLDDPNFVPSNTDWQQEIYQTAPISNIDFGASGGTERSKFNVQANIFNQEGVQIETGLKRLAFNANSEFKIKDFLTFGETLNIGRQEFSRPEQDGGRTVQQWAYLSSPYLDPIDEEGRFIVPTRDLDGANPTNNPLLIQRFQDNTTERFSTTGTLYGRLTLVKGLTNTVRVGLNIFQETVNAQSDIFDRENSIGDANRVNKTITKNRNNTVQGVFTNILNYKNNFNNVHDIDITGIFERSRRVRERIGLFDVNQLSNSIREINTPDGNILTETLPSSLLSYAGRFTYGFKNRYLIYGSIRRDASSRFDAETGRSDLFYGGSAGWVISEEPFLRNVNWLTNLKLKASYGEAGNDNIPEFSVVPGLPTDFNAVINGNIVTGAGLTTFPSRGLFWERSVKQNYGADIRLFNNLDIQIEYYINENEDLLVPKPTPSSAGATEFPIRNLAAVRTDGWEVTVNFGDYKGDFTWNLWTNVSTVNSEVLRTDGEGNEFRLLTDNAFGQINLNQIAPGKPLYSFIGFKTDGLIRDIDELRTGIDRGQVFIDTNNENPMTRTPDLVERTFNRETNSFEFTNSRTNQRVDISDVGVDGKIGTAQGDIKYVDINQNGTIDGGDITTIGDPNPDFIFSSNLKMKYKNFDFSALITGAYGGDILNAAAAPLRIFDRPRNYDVSILDRYYVVPTGVDASTLPTRYQTNNTNTNVPRFAIGDPGRNGRVSDRFLEDGSYARLKNVSFGYNFSTNSLKGMLGGNLSKLRFYVSGQNLYTLTNYSGPDPATPPAYGASGTIVGLGVDRGFSPVPATLTMGVEVEF